MSARPPEYSPDALFELTALTEKVLDNQEKMQQDLSEIKQSIFHPDEGLYARVRRNTLFRAGAVRWLWILTTGLTISLLHIFFKLIVK